jgi:hypothetical protein
MGNPQAPRSENIDFKHLPQTREEYGDAVDPGQFSQIYDPYNYPPEEEAMMERNHDLARGENYDINQKNIRPPKQRRFRDPIPMIPYETEPQFYEAATRFAASLETNQ